MLNIVFGSSKQGNQRVSEQEFTSPSIKIEASRGAGTSRRVLFNRAATNLLELENGVVQEMLFGFAHDESNQRLFIINTAEFAREVEQKTYKTSKNRVSYTDSKEKGKGISSTPLSNELRSFLGFNDDAVDLDLSIKIYDDSGEAVVYELTVMTAVEDTVVDPSDIAIETVDAVVEEIVEDTVQEYSPVSAGFGIPV